MARRIVAGLMLALTATAAARADDGPPPVVVEDPHYGEVLFYFYQGEYFDAIVRLLAAESMQRLPNHDDEAELLLGGLYLSYGQHGEAAAIFDRLLAGNTSESVRDRTWFFLAKIRYQRGYYPEAEAALTQISGKLPKELEPERRMLHAQVLMRQDRYAEAAEVLDRWRGDEDWVTYARFNLGVALVRSGEIDEGARLLDKVGQIDEGSDERLGLRDKANLALGYAWLQDGRPEAARPVLQRVRLEGPFSNKALLGVGWADAELGNYRRALVPWMELRDRDLLDSAVQESLLAIPYALAKLEATSQAADHYVNAVEAFVEEAQAIDLAIDDIRSGRMVEALLAEDRGSAMGWYWQLESLPRATESRYLYHLLASHRFQEALKNYRDLRLLERNLYDWRDSLEVFSDMLETRELAFVIRLPKVERALAAADLDELDAGRRSLAGIVAEIARTENTLGLATPREYELWSTIDALSGHPDLATDPEAREKLRLIEGVVEWQLARNFKARMWRQQKSLRDIERALVAARRARNSVVKARNTEPELFAEFNARIAGLEPRIDTVLAKVERLRARQEAFLGRLAVRELQAQQRRIDTYMTQARFALASIYDRASSGASSGASTGASESASSGASPGASAATLSDAPAGRPDG